MFPNLKTIKIILDLYELEESESVLEAFRRLDDLRAQEENGLLKLVTVNVMEHVACHSVLEGCDAVNSAVGPICRSGVMMGAGHTQ